jgi:Lrp/AsnC family transcriptional regulator, regulator for asnA, asnC and gidA
MMKIDDTNKAIINHLRDGRKSFKLIAQDLNITINTVRARVSKLVNEGLLDIVGLVDTEFFEGHRVAIIAVKIANMNLIKKGEELSKLKGVISASIVTGRYDIIITVLLKEQFGLLEFLTGELSKVKDIQSTETFVVYKSFNLKVPYPY